MAKVWLKNQEVLKYLKHPVSKTGFRDANAYAVWPDDSFTARRIRDGDVTIEDPGAAAKKHEQDEQQRREREQHQHEQHDQRERSRQSKED
jgi:hypothetical protein